MTVGSSSASATEAPSELGGRVVERQAAVDLQRAARQRVAVGVQAAGRHADERVAGRDAVAEDRGPPA